MPIGFLQEIGQIAGIGGWSGILHGIINFIINVAFLVVILVVGLWFAYWYLNREKYNIDVEIWDIKDKENGIPDIYTTKGGFFTEKGITDFRLLGQRYENAVVNINPKHVLRMGRKTKVYLRREGVREFYSFIPKVWVDKNGNKVVGLEVENSSIVNLAILKDKMIRDKVKKQEKWMEYLKLGTPYFLILGIIIVAYFTYKHLGSVVEEAKALRLACRSAAQTGGWLLFLLSKKLFKGGKK